VTPSLQWTSPDLVKPRLALIVTSPFAVNAFWTNHLDTMRRAYAISVLVNITDPQLKGVVTALPAGVELVPLKLQRDIRLADDWRALLAIHRYLVDEKIAIAITMTPKAGLMGMLAAKWAKVPVRVHWFTGQVWATRKGWMRQLLKATDRITIQAATAVLADSHTQADFLAREGIAARSKFEVLGSGSVSGVDCEVFKPDAAARQEVRTQLGIADDEIALIFAGRVNRDKGVVELIEAFARLRRAGHKVRLIMVGPDEGNLLAQPLPEGLIAMGYAQTVHRYFQAADIFCLPSHREGFGLVLIEAGACGLPAVASRIYGITDAMLDGVTGLLHTPEDPGDIFQKVERLIQNPELRQRLGQAARQRALNEFTSARLTKLLMARLKNLLPS
jgi:glycosyltransferase involved in cell wall biosynthesis